MLGEGLLEDGGEGGDVEGVSKVKRSKWMCCSFSYYSLVSFSGFPVCMFCLCL